MRSRSGRSSSNFEIEFVGLLPGAARAMTEVFIRDAIDKMIINALCLALYQENWQCHTSKHENLKGANSRRCGVRFCDH